MEDALLLLQPQWLAMEQFQTGWTFQHYCESTQQ
jgi:hypothetical protein